MKGIFLGLILMFSSFAQAENLLHVKDFNFNYTNPSGEGEAAAFSRGFKSQDGKIRVSLERTDQDFVVRTFGEDVEEYQIKGAPSFMTDADSMSISGLNIDINQTLQLQLDSGRFDSRSDSLRLNGLTLDCQRDLLARELMDQAISGCIQKMALKSSRFSSQGSSEFLAALIEDNFAPAANVGVNSLDLKINSGRLDLAGEVKAQISGKVKATGNISYDQSTGVLKIKISEVKFGFLNITGKVFDELKKQESATLSVNKPYVYLSIK